MITWGSLRATVRLELKDPAKTKWNDDLLYTYVKDAIRDYSTFLPRVHNRVLIEKLEEKYTLPDDFKEIILVESPLGSFLKKRTIVPGTRLRTRTHVNSYYIQDKELILNSETTDEVYVTYNAVHAIPANATDDTFEFTFPDEDEEIIRLYMKAAAHGFVRSKSARLDRFKPVGKRDDNPLNPEVEAYMDEYDAKINQRVGGKVHFLHRKRA